MRAAGDLSSITHTTPVEDVKLPVCATCGKEPPRSRGRRRELRGDQHAFCCREHRRAFYARTSPERDAKTRYERSQRDLGVSRWGSLSVVAAHRLDDDEASALIRKLNLVALKRLHEPEGRAELRLGAHALFAAAPESDQSPAARRLRVEAHGFIRDAGVESRGAFSTGEKTFLTWHARQVVDECERLHDAVGWGESLLSLANLLRACRFRGASQAVSFAYYVLRKKLNERSHDRRLRRAFFDAARWRLRLSGRYLGKAPVLRELAALSDLAAGLGLEAQLVLHAERAAICRRVALFDESAEALAKLWRIWTMAQADGMPRWLAYDEPFVLRALIEGHLSKAGERAERDAAVGLIREAYAPLCSAVSDGFAVDRAIAWSRKLGIGSLGLPSRVFRSAVLMGLRAAREPELSGT